MEQGRDFEGDFSGRLGSDAVGPTGLVDETFP